jgi:aminodeoxyfutalosine synthase
MLVGHVETAEHRVDHMRRLRELQDETRGFTAFIPLAFHPANTQLAHLQGPSGYDMLRTLAIGRIYLDNFDHVKAYWIMLGLKLAQVSLGFGVDDLDGTVMEEKIYHMAGATTPEEVTRQELVKAIRETGREPVERDSLYRPVIRKSYASGNEVGARVVVADTRREFESEDVEVAACSDSVGVPSRSGLSTKSATNSEGGTGG